MFSLMHIVGIGGIGMSALAEVAHRRGFSVQGSDESDNANTRRLKGLGIKIFSSHAADNIKGASCLVYSTAIGEDNPERVAACASGLTLWHRADMLAWLMAGKKTITISGTHGKTTTTALIGTILEQAGFDPTIINGGLMTGYGSNVRYGAGDWMVVEGDESDGTFTRLPTDIAVITNIDREHLSHYAGFDNLLRAFESFLSSAKKFAIIPKNDEYVERLSKGGARCLSYGLGEVSEVEHKAEETRWCFGGKKFSLPLLGEHNVCNALAAIRLAQELGIDDAVIVRALESFKGVGRRFTFIGELSGVKLYDDYAHHPKEILVTIEAVKKACAGSVGVVVQPHRFSRLEDLFDEFVSSVGRADKIALAPVYAAGESPRTLDHRALAEALRQGGQEVALVETAEDIAAFIKQQMKAGDRVIGMGAGSIGALMKEAINVG